MAALREDQVQAAVRFINNPSVADRSSQEKQDFLSKKGLTAEEVAEAMKRAASPDGSSSASSAPATPAASTAPATASRPAAPAAPPPVTAPGGTLRGGYPAQPGGYPAPAGVAPVPTGAAGYAPAGYAPAGYPPAGPVPMPPPQAWPAPFPQQAAPTSWSVWLLGGLGLGSLLAFLFNLLRSMRRPRQAALQLNASAVPGAPPVYLQQQQQHPQAWHQVIGPNGTSHFVPSIGSQPALMPPPGSDGVATATPPSMEPVENGSVASGTNNVPRLEELAGYVRRHVEENREATSSLRRTLEMQQRQYQTALTDFQKKVEEAAKRKPSAALPRMEIAPESMKMLKSLITPAAARHSGVLETADGGDTMRQWFAQVELALRRLLHAAPCKAEAKKSLQTLSLIVSNLVSTSAQQEKYREVNTSSDRFRQQLGGPDGGAAELLQLAGFDRRDTGFVFPSDGQRSLDKAERVRDFLTSAVRDSDQRWDEAQAEGGEGGNALPGPPLAEPSAAVLVQEAAAEAPTPQRPPWASSASAVAAAVAANGTAPNVAACAVSAAPAAEVQPPVDAASSSSASSSKAGRAPAPWLSSALQRGLNRKPGATNGEASSESPAPAAAHPAESADLEETQRAPG